MTTYQLITMTVAIVAIAMSGATLFFQLRSKKSTVLFEMTQQCNLINEATAPFGIRSPYAVLMGLKKQDKEKIVEFEALSAIFFHHLNLISLVHHNKRILGDKVYAGYLRWIKTVFRPWVESDEILLWHWSKTKETKDLYGNNFIDWLDNELGIHRDTAS